MASVLPGYRRLPGSQRRYETPSGAIISRREYDKRVAAEGKHKTISPVRRAKEKQARESRDFLLRTYIEKEKAEGRGDALPKTKSGKVATRRVEGTKEFREAARRISKAPPKSAEKRKALEDAGMREGLSSAVPTGINYEKVGIKRDKAGVWRVVDKRLWRNFQARTRRAGKRKG